jgi:DNA mismatch endonuclease (patch repair protein)
MRAVRARDTHPELRLRQALHAAGLRYRLHEKKLPGSPDLVFPKYKAVLFVHGCFWHLHGCRYSKIPETRADFWTHKLKANQERDRRVRTVLLESGWRVGIVWECSLRSNVKAGVFQVAEMVGEWLHNNGDRLEIPLSDDT